MKNKYIYIADEKILCYVRVKLLKLMSIFLDHMMAIKHN